MFCYTVHMSTGYGNTSQRFAKLAQMNESVFHARDLANLWQIKNKNTLHTTLKRYVQNGLLFRIYKGFYAIGDIKKINPFLLGVKALNGFAYVSTETVLAENGIILQSLSAITLISSKSKKFFIGENFYQARKLSDKYLFNTSGINLENGFYKASVERAAADLLYFNPHYFFDGGDMINWKKVCKIQKEIGYK